MAPSSAPATLMVPADDEELAWLAYETLTSPLEKSTVTSCLVAVPGEQTWELETNLPKGAAWAQPGVVGNLHVVQVFVDTAKVPAEGARLELAGFAGVAGKRMRPSDAGRADVLRMLDGVLLNPGDIDYAWAEPKGTGADAIPSPPGDYRVSYAAGAAVYRFDLDTLSIPTTATVSLAYHGTLLPMIERTAGNEVLFFGPWNNTLTNRTDSVFITAGPEVSSVLADERPAFQTLSPVGTEVSLPRTRIFEQNTRYERAAVRPVGERFVANRIGRGQSTTLSLPLRDVLTSSQIDVVVDVLSYNTTIGTSPDHYGDFRVQYGPALADRVTLPRVQWTGRAAVQLDTTISIPLPNPANLTFVHSVPTDTQINGGADLQNLDKVTLEWQGKPRLESNNTSTIALAAAGDGQPRRVTVGGLPGGTTATNFILLDVTAPKAPVAVTNPPLFVDGSGTVGVEWEAPSSACTFFLQLRSSVSVPSTAVPAETLPGLPGGEELLWGFIVRPPEFASAMAPLEALRDPGVLSFEPQAAYNAYSHGQEDPEAIRQALAAYLAAAPSRAPWPWVLLASHGSLDRKGYLGLNDGPQIPMFIDQGVVTSGGFEIETPTDYPYSLLAGGDQLPDAMVGRIPAKNLADMNTAVARILAHDAARESLRSLPRRGLFVTDDEAGFLADTPEWKGYFETTGRPAITHNVDQTTTDTQAIKEAFEGPQGGLAFALYVGHGNIGQWADEKVLLLATIDTINTNGQWPVVAALTCLNGYYAFPGAAKTVSEKWMFTNANKGAVANFAPTAVDFYDVMRLFIREFMQSFADTWPYPAARAGELLTRGQLRFAVKYPEVISTAREYHLFGDPATDLTLFPPPPAEVEQWREIGDE